MNQYKVLFSYTLSCGRKIEEFDISRALTAQEVVDNVRESYHDLKNFKVLAVWFYDENQWIITARWD